MATCNTPIGKGALSFMCDLPASHDGPHRAHGNDRSLRERSAWEEAQAVLRESQGKPLTMSQRTEGTETGTPPPGFFPCAYHRVIHHNDVRSGKCIAWSGPHDGPQPRTIQRLPATMGTSTVFTPLPDMDDDPNKQRAPIAEGEMQGTTFVPTHPAEGSPAGDEHYRGIDPESEEQNGPATDQRIGEPDRRYQASDDQYAKTHDRPEDQPMPIPNDRPTAHALLIEMVQGRLDLGIKRYGTGLQPFNGRDSALDALEELVDLAVYLITHREERSELLGLLSELRPMVGMSIRGNEIIDRFHDYLSGTSS